MRDVIIVGGGAAGLAAAIFTAQAGLDTLVLDAGGSTMLDTLHIRNYLGFPRVVGGGELLKLGRKHLERYDGQVKTALVTGARRAEDGFEVTTREGPVHRSRYLVLCTGHATNLAEGLGLDLREGLGGRFPDHHIATDEACRAAPGVYAAGLARRWEYQAQITAGDGARAAVTLLSDHQGEAYVRHDE